MFEDLLKPYKLKFEDLNSLERETLRKWADRLQTTPLTVDDIRNKLTDLILAIERDLASLDEPETFWQWLFRRRRAEYRAARLQNYLLLRDFIDGPARAKQALDAHLKRLSK